MIKLGTEADMNALNEKPLSEQETRLKLYNRAKRLGCEKEYKLLLNKIDTMMRNCTNDKERADIAEYGAMQVHILLFEGTLYVDNKLVRQE